MEICAVCGDSASQKCSGCNGKFYCGKDHQRDDWKRGHKKECRCYEIACNEILGRYMIAKRDIKPGEIILREGPCVIGPKIMSHVLCLGCLKAINPPSTDDYYKCSKCTWPVCGRSCENMKNHVDECRVLSERNFKCSIVNNGKVKVEASYCLIAPLRVILLRHSNPRVYKTIMELVSHLNLRIDTKLYSALRVNLVPFVRDFLKFSDYTETDILNIAGILDTNCFDIILPTKQIRARGIYPLTAMMAHECVPNTKHFFDGDSEIKVIACSLIKKGEMILTSYTHPLKTTIERRHQLKEAKCFDCICPRCQDPTEMNSFASGIKCVKCIDGVLIPVDPLDQSSDWRCTECKLKAASSQVMQVFNKARSTLDALNKKSIDDCESFLVKFESILPASSVIMIDVKYALSLLYGNVEGFMIEDLKPAQVSRKLNLCKQMIEVLNILEPGISNSVVNVTFELSVTRIAQIKQQVGSENLTKIEAVTEIEIEVNKARNAFNILMAGSEGKLQLENRMKRVMTQSSLPI